MVAWPKDTAPHDADFASVASHELRTPLSVIKWYTEILLDEDMGSLNENQRKYLKVIASSNEKAIALVTSLLNLSRVELGTFRVSPEPLFLTDVVKEVLKKLESKAGKRSVTIAYKETGDFSFVKTDKNILMFLFTVIVQNALLYSKEGGAVIVHIKGSPSLVELIVEDKGIGIPKKEKEKVFSRLFRGSNVPDEVKGAGLGLYTAKLLLSKVGGTLYFTSEEGAGSTFVLNLPTTGMSKKKGITQLDL